MNTCIFITGYLMQLFLSDYQTLEVRYYQPSEAVTAGYMEKGLDFVLHCNARRSLFMHLSDHQFEYELPISNGKERRGQSLNEKVWIAKDLLTGQMIQYAESIQGDPYIIEDLIHPMQWKILEEARIIGGMKAQKAECNYRGRYFTAWFAPSIPMDNGPWKLGGLPGLILEAYDEEREVVFLFKSLKIAGWKTLLPPVLSGRKIKLKTYLDLNKKELKQYLDFMEHRLQSFRADIQLDLCIGKFSSWEYP